MYNPMLILLSMSERASFLYIVIIDEASSLPTGRGVSSRAETQIADRKEADYLDGRILVNCFILLFGSHDLYLFLFSYHAGRKAI